MPYLLAASLAALPLLGGCLSFRTPPPGSQCRNASPELRWTNQPAELTPAPLRPAYDATLNDPAFLEGVALRGEQRFAFSATGAHLVEILVANPEADRFTFRLLAAGKLVDERPVIAPGPARMRPKRAPRHTNLLAMVDGPVELTLSTQAPAYTLIAVRWTPRAHVDSELVPRWRERVRYLHSHYLPTAQGATARRAWIEQVAGRMAFSSRPEDRDEALLMRLRAWFWLAAENHEPDDLLQTELLIREALRRLPRHPVVRQMISAACTGQVVRGQRMPQGDYCAAVPPVPWEVDAPLAPASAPAWATAQRRLARRMDALTRWWVEHRQAPNGELGGGWGDDVEILRHWGPQALGFGSEVAARGIRNLAGGLWNSGTLLHGYDRGISDVEHSSEPTTDTQPLAAALAPGDPELVQRLRETAACSEYWITRQPDGWFRFRSSWFNCREADTSPARAVDVHLNTRAIGPALWYAYLTRDPALIQRLASWGDAWIRAMRDSRHGKPAGIFPPVLRSSDGSYLIGSDRWDRPDAEWDYFQWSGRSQESLTSLVLALHELTGERRYLDAATESFRPLDNCASHPELCREIVSSPEAFYFWRGLTSNARYDRAFSYVSARPDSEILAGLAKLGQDAESTFAVNWDILTSEVIYTDRVHWAMPADYRWRLFGGEAPRGDRYPTFAVTWPETKVEFARAVLAASSRRIRLRLYSFDPERGEAPLRLWRLEPGEYQWETGGASGRFTVTRLPLTITIPLPPRQEIELAIRKTG